MFALPVILIFTILLITIQIPIICTLYYSQNYMLKMLSIKLSINMQSHPLRVRGLKLKCFLIVGCPQIVASFTGAWIETSKGQTNIRRGWVASFTGAWIETACHAHGTIPYHVASFTGAWIETKGRFGTIISGKSHPLRVRGLKPYKLYAHMPLYRRILYGCVD